MEKTGSKRAIKLLLKVLVTLAAGWFISQKIDFSALGDALSTVNPFWLLPALLLFVLSKVLSAFRLQLFWDRVGARLSTAYNLRLYLLGMFYNLFLPGGIGGDGYKVYLLKKEQGLGVKRLVVALFLDRLSGLGALVMLALAVSVLVVLPYRLHEWIWMMVPVVVGLHGLGLRLLFRDFLPTLVPAAIWSLGVQGAQALAAICLVMGLGVEGEWAAYVFIFLLSSVVLVVPLPSFGGLGLREAVILLGANQMGLDPAVSVTLSLLFYIISAAVSACGVYFHFRPEKMNPTASSPD